MKVLFLSESPGNPYQHLLSKGLEQFSIKVNCKAKIPSEIWLFKNRTNFQVLHIHWPHMLYQQGKNIPLCFIRFTGKLILARLLGYKIVWTVHNLMPHDQLYPVIDYLVRLFIVKIAHSIIVHCGYAKDKVVKKFRRKKGVYVIPHGNYLEIYPSSNTKEEARQILGIHNSAFVYLFFGAIRSYKGVDCLVKAFNQLVDKNVVLLIAGKCSDSEEKILTRMTQHEKRIKLFLEFIPNEKVPLFFKSADVHILPFSEVLTSGSMILGLSFSIPVIAPALGCLPEILSPKAGILYNTSGENGLLKALQTIKQKDVAEMGRQAYKVAAALDWKTIANKTYQVYSHN